jgi:hypothetical protein
MFRAEELLAQKKRKKTAGNRNGIELIGYYKLKYGCIVYVNEQIRIDLVL